MFKRQHLWVSLALLAGFGLRWYFVQFHTHVEGDSLVYGDLATNLLRHHIYGFTEAHGIRPTLIRLPGYPVFLAACFAAFGTGRYTGAILVQLLLDLVSCGLMALLVRRLAGPRAAMFALWLAALCPFTSNYVSAPLTETPAVFCAALAFYALSRWTDAIQDAGGGAVTARHGLPWSAAIGAALSVAVLLRPDRALLAVAVVSAMAWIATRKRASGIWQGLRSIALVCCLVALPLAGWAIRNWREFHVFQPLAPRQATDPGELVNFGFQRWYRTWAIDFISTVDVYWSYDGSALLLSDLPARALDNSVQETQTAALYTLYNESLAPTPAMDAVFAQLAADRVQAHPLRYYLVMPVFRLANMWLRPRTEMLPVALDWWNLRSHLRMSAFAAAYAGLNLAYLLLAAAGLVRWRRLRWSGCRPLALAMLAYVLLRSALLLTMDNSEPRYTIDCYPVVLVFAALSLEGRGANEERQLTSERTT